MERRGARSATRRSEAPHPRASIRQALRRDAAQILAAGLRAADPERLVRQSLSVGDGRITLAGQTILSPRGRIVLLAVGKAAYRMAAAAAKALGERLDEGFAIGPEEDAGYLARFRRVRVRVASHPLPDERGLATASEVEKLALGLGSTDLLLVLLSGGASALLPLPSRGLSLGDKSRTTALLLRSGASIQEINTVRRHLSRLKGEDWPAPPHPPVWWRSPCRM